MDARPIGEILSLILERCVRLDPIHWLLRMQKTSADKKQIIMRFRESGSITSDEASLLIEAYQLETA